MYKILLPVTLHYGMFCYQVEEILAVNEPYRVHIMVKRLRLSFKRSSFQAEHKSRGKTTFKLSDALVVLHKGVPLIDRENVGRLTLAPARLPIMKLGFHRARDET